MTDSESQYRQRTDDNLVYEGNISASIEMMRRLRESLDASNESAAALTTRLEHLNVWLFRITVALGALTLVQIGLGVVQILIALKVIAR